MSASTTPTRQPSLAKYAAKLVVMALLPTPPLPLITAMACRTPAMRALSRSACADT